MADREAILKSIPTSWREHAPFAQWLVRRVLPCSIVDLGVDYGFSTFTFALSGIGHVCGIDSFEGDSQAGQRNTEVFVRTKQRELDLANCSILRGYFDEVAATWTTPIDILHIDGFHAYESVKKDYETWSRFLKPNGVVLMHDTCVLNYGVKDLYHEIELPKVNFGHCYGLGVISRDAKLIGEIKEIFGDKLMA